MVRPVPKPSPSRQPGPLPDAFPALVPPSGLPRRRGLARAAGFRLRHVLLTLVFLLLVPVPVGLSAWYLEARAQPQYASSFGFVIHSEGDTGVGGLLTALPAIGAIGGNSSKDTDVLARFFRSQNLVEEMDQRLDLAGLWSSGHARDPVFAFDPTGTIEDLTRYWQRMVDVHHDYAAGLMEVEVRSFDPQSARALARAIEMAASDLINRLSGIARDDRLHHTRRELDRAETRLTDARQALTAFRAKHQLIDPLTDLAGDALVIAELQKQLAEESVATEVLRQTLAEGRTDVRRTDSGDFRIRMSERKIAVLRQRIAEERAKVSGASGDRNYARLMAEFERLSVRVEIAEQTYVAALAAHDIARAEADRQTRYVATYAAAALPERALHPRKARLLGLVAIAAVLTWSVVMLVVYGLRDRF